MNRRKAAIPALLLVLASCHVPAPVVRKPLPIEGKSSEEVAVSSTGNDSVRIGIRVDAQATQIGSEGAIEAMDLDTSRKESWPPGMYNFTAEEGRLYFEGKPKGRKLRLRPDTGKFLQCGTNNYRGELIVLAAGGEKLTVVNELSIDNYLKGVLPREVVVTWADQALRVQAVASRTYLASHLNSHSKQGFNLCSDVHCQVYGGTTKEHPRTNEAVDATRDQILVYNGKPIGAFFHANCGGSTEQIKPVWGADNQPYLPRKKCPYGNANPRNKWTISFSDDVLLETLVKKTKVRGTKLKSLRVKKKSLSGRAEIITINTDEGSFDLKGNEFRIAMHPEKIRSTLFTNVRRHGNGYEFSGLGWGHGVGMCQWGAKGQAELGRDYRDILEFYYPHTEIKLWSR